MKSLTNLLDCWVLVLQGDNVVDVPFTMVCPRHSWFECFLEVCFEFLDSAPQVLDTSLAFVPFQCIVNNA